MSNDITTQCMHYFIQKDANWKSCTHCGMLAPLNTGEIIPSHPSTVQDGSNIPDILNMKTERVESVNMEAGESKVPVPVKDMQTLYDLFADWYHDDGSRDNFFQSEVFKAINNYANTLPVPVQGYSKEDMGRAFNEGYSLGHQGGEQGEYHLIPCLNTFLKNLSSLPSVNRESLPVTDAQIEQAAQDYIDMWWERKEHKGAARLGFKAGVQFSVNRESLPVDVEWNTGKIEKDKLPKVKTIQPQMEQSIWEDVFYAWLDDRFNMNDSDKFIVAEHISKLVKAVDVREVDKGVIEQLARDCFVHKKNKEGEPYTQLVGQSSPNGWRKHFTSFKKGYYAALKQAISLPEQEGDAKKESRG